MTELNSEMTHILELWDRDFNYDERVKGFTGKIKRKLEHICRKQATIKVTRADLKNQIELLEIKIQ